MTDGSTGAIQAQGQNTARHVGTLVAAALVELQRAAHRLGKYPPNHPLIPPSISAVQRSIDAAAAAAGRDRIDLQIRSDRVLFNGSPVEERNATIRMLAAALQESEVASLTLVASLGESETTSFVQWVSKLRTPGGTKAGAINLRAAGVSGIPSAPEAGRASAPSAPDPAAVAGNILDQFASGVFRGEHVDPSAAAEGTPLERFATALEWGVLEKGASRIGLELLALEATLQSVPEPVRVEILRIVRQVVSHLEPGLRSEMPPVFASDEHAAEAVRTYEAESEQAPEPRFEAIEDDPTIPSEPAAYLGDRYVECADPVSRRAKGVAIAARLIREGLSGDESASLAALIRESAREMLENGRYEELLQSSEAARQLREDPEAGGEARAEAERFIDWLRAKETITAIVSAADETVEGPETSLAGLFATTGAEGVTRAFELTVSLPDGQARDRHVHLLAASEGEDILAGFRSLHVRADAAGLASAVALLRRLPVREANQLAQELTGHAEPIVRSEAYRTLSVVDRRDGAFDRVLEGALGDPEESVRSLGITLLSERACDRSCLLLARFVGEDFGPAPLPLRLAALEALGKIPTSAARDALIDLLLSGRLPWQGCDAALRESAERSLSAWDDPPARDALKKWKRGPSRLSGLFAPRAGARR